jgi:hypothetical protein
MFPIRWYSFLFVAMRKEEEEHVMESSGHIF